MTSNSLPTPPEPPTRPSQSSSDGGFTFRIKRVQEWTLGAVVVAAASIGIWIGTLNTKLDHIEKFVDSASDASTGIFVRLATIQTMLEVLEKKGSESSGTATNVTPFPPITLNVPATSAQANPNQLHDFTFDKLIEYELVEGMLKPESKVDDAGPSKPAPVNTPLPNSNTLQQEQSLWLKDIKQTALTQLQDLENKVITDKTMPPETKKSILDLIDLQRSRLNALLY
jgi:hypothetical protein